MAGGGISPSPAISFEGSTIITRFSLSSPSPPHTHPGPVIVAEAADAGDYVINVLFFNFFIMEHHLPSEEAGFRGAAQVQDNLRQFPDILLLAQRLPDTR